MNCVLTNHYYNDLDKSKTDIEYHWGEIEKKVPLRTSATYNGNDLELPPVVVLRQLTEARDPDTGIPYDKAYTLGPNSSKWYSIIYQNPNIESTKDTQTFFSYIMENLDKKYNRAGSVGAMGGQGSWSNSSGLPMVNKVCIVNFNGSGVRITNMLSTNQTIPLKYSATKASSIYGGWDDTAYPPYVDLIYIRKDLVSTCY